MRHNILRIAVCLLILIGGFIVVKWTIRRSRNQAASGHSGPRAHDHRPPGFWFIPKRKNPEYTRKLSDEEREKLASIGYVDGMKAPTGRTGVVIRKETLMEPGLNLYTSGHGPEAILMNSRGNVYHRWKLPFNQAFPVRIHKGRVALGSHYWPYICLRMGISWQSMRDWV
jgi:hypothetical protein